jgi:transketolase
MLNERSKQVRRDLYKLSKANGGYHYGGTFSTIEILTTLYDKVLTSEDRFILSKGHACWGLYVLLREKGLRPTLEGHPHLDVANGIHWTTGSEGHGLPAGLGMAFAKKKLKKPGRVFVLMGDGECQEGTTWESLLLAGKHKLNNLIVIVDNNKIQGSGLVDDILPINHIGDVAHLCHWDSTYCDGHNVQVLETIFNNMYSPRLSNNKPVMIVANTVKGKGVDFMEGKPEWHSKWPNAAEEAEILKQLS